jgi:hypothetical protein
MRLESAWPVAWHHAVMQVWFRRTGERRYAVIVRVPGLPEQGLDPAPGYDDHIPHDLVHYVVEAELGLEAGVYGRAARGGGTFIRAAHADMSVRDRARQRRKQQRLERSLGIRADNRLELLSSERLAGICDVHWRRRHGQRADPGRSFQDDLSIEDRARVARVLDRLDRLAPLWSGLPVDGAIGFHWPSTEPVVDAVGPYADFGAPAVGGAAAGEGRRMP